jgi:hypothetical protein
MQNPLFLGRGQPRHGFLQSRGHLDVQDLLHVLGAFLRFRPLLVQKRRHLCRGVGAHRPRRLKHQARGIHDFLFGIRGQLVPNDITRGGVTGGDCRQKKNIELQKGAKLVENPGDIEFQLKKIRLILSLVSMTWIIAIHYPPQNRK